HALEGWCSPQERRLLFRVDAVRTQRNGLVHRDPLGARIVAEASRQTFQLTSERIELRKIARQVQRSVGDARCAGWLPAFHWGARIAYTATSSKRSHRRYASRCTPSMLMPSFCRTRPDATFRVKWRPSTRWSPSSANA